MNLYNNLVTANNNPRITKKLAYSQLLRNRKFKLVEKPKDTREFFLSQYHPDYGYSSISKYITQFVPWITFDPDFKPTYFNQFSPISESDPDFKPTYITQFSPITESDPNYKPTFIYQYAFNPERDPTIFIKQHDKELFVREIPEPNNSRPIALFHQYSAGQTWYK